jgi:integrase
VYGAVRLMFKDARREELITENPCVLDKRDVPAVVDKDPEWRPGARYSRDELATLVYDPRLPQDRRVLFALEGLGALRHGEAAGLRWRHLDDSMKPLGRILVATSYDSTTKTERPREMPVHPALAALLASWRADGWPAMFGRQPGPDDLLVPLEPDPPRKRARPNPRAGGGMRNKNDSFNRFKTDMATLGLRHRRGHDLRRTMISLAREDGARPDILEMCTHTPGGTLHRGPVHVDRLADPLRRGWQAAAARTWP